MTSRTFDDQPAVREQTPLLIGIVSPSGAGKTMSALRLGAGICDVTGGTMYGIDTEARRMLHYATEFNFRHVPFGAPFSPLDYLAAINHCIEKAKPTGKPPTIIVDSTSLEHEGTGGVLEMHEAALDKMAGNDWEKREKMNMLAWGKPKRLRRKLINAILQMNANFIFCFRAKEKLKIVKGAQPLALGFQAISGDEWIYEMQLKCLLLPGSDGVPIWKSDRPGEALTIKLPKQFRPFFPNRNEQLSEDIGRKLAAWAAGEGATVAMTAEEMLTRYAACSDGATWRSLERSRGIVWKDLDAPTKTKVKAASSEAAARIEKVMETPTEAPDDDGDDVAAETVDAPASTDDPDADLDVPVKAAS